MSFKEDLAKALAAKQQRNIIVSEDAAYSARQQRIDEENRQRLGQNFLLEIDERHQQQEAKLYTSTFQRSGLDQKIREAAELVSGVITQSSTTEDQIAEEKFGLYFHNIKSITMSIRWGGNGSYGDFDYNYNFVDVSADTKGTISITGGKRFNRKEWEQNTSLLEQALHFAMLNPEYKAHYESPPWPGLNF